VTRQVQLKHEAAFGQAKLRAKQLLPLRLMSDAEKGAVQRNQNPLDRSTISTRVRRNIKKCRSAPRDRRWLGLSGHRL